VGTLEQSPGKDGEIQDRTVALGYLAVGERREYLDKLGLGAPDELEAPLDGPRVYGEEPLDGYEAGRLGELDHVPVRGDYTLDLLGESVGNENEARVTRDAYVRLLDRIREEQLDANVSVKLTALGLDVSEDLCVGLMHDVLARARQHANFVRIDMESSAYTERTLEFFRQIRAEGYTDVGVVIQSYLYRSDDDVRELNRLGARVRLCKGAYLEPEEVAYPEKADVDANFVRLMRLLLTEGNYPGIATHDPAMIEATESFARERQIPDSDFEFQMLYGVRRDIQQRLVEDGHNLRIYIPFGEAWYSYLMRRMAERPANVFFIVNAVARESPLRFLLSDRGSGNGHRG
jgi:proline dehydrogenase